MLQLLGRGSPAVIPRLSRAPMIVRDTARFFSYTPLALAKPLPPLPKILDSEITETFLKGSGPGGQKINKTSSAVQLQHHPTGIVVKCQATRSRSQNRKMARRLLAERIEELQLGDQARTRKKQEEMNRKKRSKEKKSKRKYRALAEQEEEVQEEEAELNDMERNGVKTEEGESFNPEDQKK